MNNFVKENLKKELKKGKGNILCIGLNDQDLLDIIDKNKNIIKCDILNNNFINKGKDISKGPKSKTIYIKNIKNVFKKKRINKIICDYNHIEKYLKTFVKDSIYITNGDIVMYGKLNKEEVNKISYLYGRYNIKNIINEDKNNYIIDFKVNNKKTNKLKDFGYLIIDFLSELYDMVTDLLVS